MGIGRTVVLTGAAGGIGMATARRLAAAGARLILLDRERDALVALAAELKQPAYPCDITDRAGVAALVGELWARHGPLHVWINNAGVGRFGPFEAQNHAEIEAAMQVNFWGSLHCIEAILPHWRAAGAGHLIQVSSAAAVLDALHMSGYAASKAAISALIRALRLETRGTGIAITEVLPSAVATPMLHPANRRALSPLVLALTITPERVAEALLHAIRHQPRALYLPRHVLLTLWLQTLAPGFTAWLLTRRRPTADLQREAERQNERS